MVDNNEPAPDGIEVPPSLPLGAAVEGVEVPPSTTYRVPPTSLESEPENVNVQQQPEQAVNTAVFGTNATMQQGQEATKNDGLQLESGTGKGTIEGRWTMVLLLAVLAAAFGSSFQFGYHIGAINVPADQIKLFIYTSHLSSKYESKFIDGLINELIINATTEADRINVEAEKQAKDESKEFKENKTTMQEQLMDEEKGTLVKKASEHRLNINLMWGFVISAFPLGAMITALTVGFMADLLGRKWAMLLNNAFAVLAAALMFMAPQPKIYNYWYLIAGRFVIGLNAGFNSGLAPMYLMEISPANLRGTIGSFAQLFVTIAILVAQCMGLPVLLGNLDLKKRSELLATERETPRFPFIFAFSIVPVLVQLCTLPFCPESPKFTLIVRGRKEQAEEDLKKLRGQDDVSAELDLINEEAIATQSQAKVTPLDMFGPDLRWPLLLAVFTMVAQQLSGINAVMFFSTSIFKSAGLKDNMPYYATIGVGTVNVLMTVVSVYFIERLGRRLLFIGGMVGMFFFTALVAICMIIVKEAEIAWVAYFSVLFVYLFIISFASGPGSIPWFYVSELFPSNARGHANSFVVLTNWFLTFVVGIGFGHLQKLLKEYSFFLFTAMLGLFIAFAFFFLPETKGKTLEEARAEMNRRRGVADTTKTAEETS